MGFAVNYSVTVPASVRESIKNNILRLSRSQVSANVPDTGRIRKSDPH